MGDPEIWSFDRPLSLRDYNRDQESIARELDTLIKRQSREIKSQDKDLLGREITPGRFSSIRSR